MRASRAKQPCAATAKCICGIEECDNGANNSDTLADACRKSCKKPKCGDNVVDAGEACDLGVNNGGIGQNCTVTCTSLSKFHKNGVFYVTDGTYNGSFNAAKGFCTNLVGQVAYIAGNNANPPNPEAAWHLAGQRSGQNGRHQLHGLLGRYRQRLRRARWVRRLFAAASRRLHNRSAVLQRLRHRVLQVLGLIAQLRLGGVARRLVCFCATLPYTSAHDVHTRPALADCRHSSRLHRRSRAASRDPAAPSRCYSRAYRLREDHPDSANAAARGAD